MANCDINTLLEAGKCYACLTPGQLDIIELQLLCEIQAAGSGGQPAAATFDNIFLEKPEGVISFVEEFVSGYNDIGALGWRSDAIGAGGSVATVNSTFGFPQCGVEQLGASTNAGGITLQLALSGSQAFDTVLTRTWEMTWIYRQGNTTFIRSYFGFGDNAAALQSNGIGFRYDTTLGDATWKGYMMVGGVQTVLSTGVAVAASFAKFKITSNGTGTVTFYINGTNVGTLSTGGPAAATDLKPMIQIIAAETVQKLVQVDFFSYQERSAR